MHPSFFPALRYGLAEVLALRNDSGNPHTDLHF